MHTAALSLVLLLQAATSPITTPEAEQLGRRFAAAGGLATMVPLIIEKDLTELAAERPALSAAERARLIEIGRAQGRRNTERLIGTLGRSYAKRLSVADLRVLVAQAEQPATARWRAIEPAVIAETMATLGEIDFKKMTAAAFCKETGKFCDRQ